MGTPDTETEKQIILVRSSHYKESNSEVASLKVTKNAMRDI